MNDVAANLQTLRERVNPLIERAERVLAKYYTQDVYVSVTLSTIDSLAYKDGKLWVAGARQLIKSKLAAASFHTRLRALEELPTLVDRLDYAHGFKQDPAPHIMAKAEAFLNELEKR